nr:MAG TPA: hypothetical protein [Caudoviricetes sp.]
MILVAFMIFIVYVVITISLSHYKCNTLMLHTKGFIVKKG